MLPRTAGIVLRYLSLQGSKRNILEEKILLLLTHSDTLVSVSVSVSVIIFEAPVVSMHLALLGIKMVEAP